MRRSARWLDVGALQDDAGAGEGGDVGHDHLGVVPGHVAPGQVLHGDQDDVGGGGDGGRHQGGCEEQITDHGRTLAWLVLALDQDTRHGQQYFSLAGTGNTDGVLQF